MTVQWTGCIVGTCVLAVVTVAECHTGPLDQQKTSNARPEKLHEILAHGSSEESYDMDFAMANDYYGQEDALNLLQLQASLHRHAINKAVKSTSLPDHYVDEAREMYPAKSSWSGYWIFYAVVISLGLVMLLLFFATDTDGWLTCALQRPPNAGAMLVCLNTEAPSTFLSEDTWYMAFAKVCNRPGVKTFLDHGHDPAALIEHGHVCEDPRSSAGHSELKMLADMLSMGLEHNFGVCTGSAVGLNMERGIQFVALILACSRVGAIAVPLPPDYPSERICKIVSLTRLRVICYREALCSLSNSCVPSIDVHRLGSLGSTLLDSHPLSDACTDCSAGGVILSSSGTTGVPKLIARSPASFYHRVVWTHTVLPIRLGEHCLQKSNMLTTHSLYEMLESLLEGAPLHILPDASKTGLWEFWRHTHAVRPQRLLLVPSLLEATLSQPECADLIPKSLKILILMGEAPKPSLCHQALNSLPDVRLLSIYGSTEASSSMVVDIGAELRNSSSHRGLPSEIQLGKPINNSIRAWVLDDNGHQVLPGETGVLHFSGVHLFREYVADEKLTKSSLFSMNLPNSGGRMSSFEVYCTQDKVRLGSGGELYHLGRADDLVKIRGNRVQLSDVDNAMVSSGMVRNSITLLVSMGLGKESVLVSFVTPGTISSKALKALLAKRLPPYMLPTTIVALDDMPLTASSKVDRAALKELYWAGREKQDQNATEQTEVDSLGLVRANAGHIGGDSDEIPKEVRTLIMAIYFVCAFGILQDHAISKLDLSCLPWKGRWLVRSMQGAIFPSSFGNLQFFIAVPGYLHAREPWSWARFSTLLVLCIGMPSFGLMLKRLVAPVITGTPSHEWIFSEGRRYFIFIVLVAYVLFNGYARRFPYPRLQCLLLGSISWVLCLKIIPNPRSRLQDLLPADCRKLIWCNHVLGPVIFNHGLGIWAWLVTWYFMAGHYGSLVVDRIRSHRLAKRKDLQTILTRCSAVVLVALRLWQSALFLDKQGPTPGYQGRGGTNPYPQVLLLADALASPVFMMLLALGIRDVAPWLAILGSMCLGIYCGANEIWVCRNWRTGAGCDGVNTLGYSFGVIIQGVAVLPPLQETLERLQGHWLLQVLAVPAYSMFMVFFLGIPFYFVYTKVMKAMQAPFESLRKGRSISKAKGVAQ